MAESSLTPAEIESAVSRAIDAKLGQFYIDRETHFKDHEWIQELRKWSEEIKGTILRSVVKTGIYALIGLVILGFIVWGKSHFGK